MSKYYDYAQEKYVEGDPMLNLYTQLLGFELLKKRARESAKRREEENARRKAADHTKSYKISYYNDTPYIKKLLKDSLKKADTWATRLQLYNELFIDYLHRKSYELKMYQKPELFALSLKEYKDLVKYVESLEEDK